ncbi:MAG TPA: glycosyltransferase [Solirubrobacteraceae bacterium]|nr:glycosyltransferase [Solirubrobacteraceae bacterium]
MATDSPHVSIIIPLTGGAAQALRCFQGVAALPAAPPYEVIVVDNASVGLEPLLAQLDGDVQVVRSERRTSFAAALQLGAGRAAADRLVLIRDAAVPGADWLAPLVSALDDASIGMAASVDAADHRRPVLAAWAAAVMTGHLHTLDATAIDDHHVLGALALAAAERGLTVTQVPESSIAAPGVRNSAARRAPGEPPELTIVIPTLDATSDRVRGCLQAIDAVTDVAHEVVIVDNGAPPQGFTAPVNAGLRAARTPYVVVMNDDVEPLPGWWEPLRDTIDAGAAVAFPLTIDGAMRTDFAAWCFAMGAETVKLFGHSPGEFFDPALVIWYQDTDLLLALRRAGRPPVLVSDARIRHGLSQTVATDDPRLSTWVRAQVARDERVFTEKQSRLRVATASA